MQKIKSFTDGYVNLPVRQLDDGSVQFDAEQAAIGFGISFVAKSGNVVVRWERVNKYLSSPEVGMQIKKGDFITEPQFYELAIKANSKKAKKFQYCHFTTSSGRAGLAHAAGQAVGPPPGRKKHKGVRAFHSLWPLIFGLPSPSTINYQ